jgi:RimJ/RimL family protein N-acetyltransferase
MRSISVIVLNRVYWGKGYATEAAMATLQYGFRSLRIPIITAMAHIENTASLKVIEKCGMHFQRFEEVETCPVKTYTSAILISYLEFRQKIPLRLCPFAFA